MVSLNCTHFIGPTEFVIGKITRILPKLIMAKLT